MYKDFFILLIALWPTLILSSPLPAGHSARLEQQVDLATRQVPGLDTFCVRAKTEFPLLDLLDCYLANDRRANNERTQITRSDKPTGICIEDRGLFCLRVETNLIPKDQHITQQDLIDTHNRIFNTDNCVALKPGSPAPQRLLFLSAFRARLFTNWANDDNSVSLSGRFFEGSSEEGWDFLTCRSSNTETPTGPSFQKISDSEVKEVEKRAELGKRMFRKRPTGKFAEFGRLSIDEAPDGFPKPGGFGGGSPKGPPKPGFGGRFAKGPPGGVGKPGGLGGGFGKGPGGLRRPGFGKRSEASAGKYTAAEVEEFKVDFESEEANPVSVIHKRNEAPAGKYTPAEVEEFKVDFESEEANPYSVIHKKNEAPAGKYTPAEVEEFKPKFESEEENPGSVFHKKSEASAGRYTPAEVEEFKVDFESEEANPYSVIHKKNEAPAGKYTPAEVEEFKPDFESEEENPGSVFHKKSEASAGRYTPAEVEEFKPDFESEEQNPDSVFHKRDEGSPAV
ncbi:hypothetical protein DFH27DRAFT_523932 [Peziza echinospora]|nr:hypothetical protein DFH27DRAFT_523932 [Peziza echinospora]